VFRKIKFLPEKSGNVLKNFWLVSEVVLLALYCRHC